MAHSPRLTPSVSASWSLSTSTRWCGSHAVLPGMLARGTGGILNVASTIAFQPGLYHAVYGASKAFVLSFSQALRAETLGSGVTVTALCPGPTATGFVAALDADVSHTAIYRRLVAPEPVVDVGPDQQAVAPACPRPTAVMTAAEQAALHPSGNRVSSCLTGPVTRSAAYESGWPARAAHLRTPARRTARCGS